MKGCLWAAFFICEKAVNHLSSLNQCKTRNMSKTDITEKLNEQLDKKVSRAEIRAMRLEVYPRLVDALEQRSGSCNTCKELYKQSKKFTDDIVLVVKGSSEARKEFEDFVNEAFGHLHDDHKALPKGKLLSVSVLVGMLTGLSVAVIIGYIMDEDVMRFGALGWMIGVITGWGIGKVRENNLRKAGNLF